MNPGPTPMCEHPDQTTLVSMTTTDDTTVPPSNFIPPTPVPPPYRRLRRSRDDRWVSGLAGGMGRYFNVDPVLFRIMFVALTLCGGSGILFYLIGWLAVAADGRDHSFIDRATSKLHR